MLIRLSEWSNEDDPIGRELWTIVDNGTAVETRVFGDGVGPGLRSVTSDDANFIVFQQIEFTLDSTQMLQQGNDITVHRIAVANMAAALGELPANSETIASPDNLVASYTRAQLAGNTDAQGQPFALQSEHIVALSHYQPNANGLTLVVTDVFELNGDSWVPFLSAIDADNNTLNTVALPGELSGPIFADQSPDAPLYLLRTDAEGNSNGLIYNAATNQLFNVSIDSYSQVQAQGGQFIARTGTEQADTVTTDDNVFHFHN
jgi:hypothetical protein